MPVIVSTIPPIRSERSPSARMTVVTSADEARTAAIAAVACSTASAPSVATLRAAWAASAVSVAFEAPACVAEVISSVSSRVDSTVRAWRSAPWATSETAWAISPTALPASSEVEAICWEAAVSDAAEDETCPIIPASAARVWL
jgi:hypothetical protein